MLIQSNLFDFDTQFHINYATFITFYLIGYCDCWYGSESNTHLWICCERACKRGILAWRRMCQKKNSLWTFPWFEGEIWCINTPYWRIVRPLIFMSVTSRIFYFCVWCCNIRQVLLFFNVHHFFSIPDIFHRILLTHDDYFYLHY